MIGKLLGQAERYVSAWRINRRGYRRAKGGSRSHPPGPPDFGRTLTRTAFALAYTSNRRNATQAAIAAGYSPNGADSKSAQLLRDVRVQNLVGTLTAQAEETAELTLEIALRQNARIAMFDVGQLYREDGTAIPIGELDPRWLGILQFGAKYCPKTEKV
jgi:hypothetical protein